MGGHIRSRAGWEKLLAVLAGVVASVVLLEVGVRGFGQLFLFQQEQRNLQALRSQSSYRILCLGDSMTAGQYPGFLDGILNKDTNRKQFAVVDRGKTGTTSDHVARAIRSSMDEIDPDFVVVMTGFNDGHDDAMPFGGVPVSSCVGRSFRSLRLFKIIAQQIEGSSPVVPFASVLKGSEQSLVSAGAVAMATDVEAITPPPPLWEIEGGPEHPHFSDLINANTITVSGTLKGISRAQVDFVELRLREGRYLPMVRESLNVTDGTFSVEAPAEYSRPLWVRVLIDLNGDGPDPNDFEGGPAEPIRLGEEDIHLEIPIRPDQAPEEVPIWERDEYRLRNASFSNPVTRTNFRRVAEAVAERGKRLIVMGYPRIPIEPLKQLLSDMPGIEFVDNERIFEDAVATYGFDGLFIDEFGQVFGHCTDRGNTLLASQVAHAILKMVDPDAPQLQNIESGDFDPVTSNRETPNQLPHSRVRKSGPQP